MFEAALLIIFLRDYNGNVISGKAYSYASGSSAQPTLAANHFFEYGTKKNPLFFGNEGFVAGGETSVGPNNCIKLTTVSVTPPSDTIIITFNYSYNSGNYPASAVATTSYQGTLTTTNGTFFTNKPYPNIYKAVK